MTTRMDEIQELKRDIAAHGQRLKALQSEFWQTASRPAPTSSTIPREPTQDEVDEKLADEIYQSGQGRRGTPGREDVSDTNDPDEKLAQQIFDAADGNTGDASEDAENPISDEDEKLADEIFAASGGNRKTNTRASNEGIVPG